MAKKGALTQGSEVQGHMIQNNGEDLEYFQALSKVSDKELGEFWDRVKEHMDAKDKGSPGILSGEGKSYAQIEAEFLDKYGL